MLPVFTLVICKPAKDPKIEVLLECICRFILGDVVPIPRNACVADSVILVVLFVLKFNACELVVPRKLLLLALLPERDQ